MTTAKQRRVAKRAAARKIDKVWAEMDARMTEWEKAYWERAAQIEIENARASAL